MIYEFSESLVNLKEAGFSPIIIFLTIALIVLALGILIENLISAIVNIVTTMFNFNKHKKYYKLVDRHLCWYRNRSRELFSDKKYVEAIEYMDKGIKDLYEVMINVFPESEKPVSRETRQDIDRSSDDTRQSHATITD